MIQPIEETRATIFDSTIDLSMDISEICLDMLLDEGVIKDIPVLGSIYKIGKAVYSVSQLNHIKKILVFAQEIQKNNVGSDILTKHKELMLSNPKKYYKELEIIIEYLDKQIGYEKAVLSGRVYYLLLSEEISYNDFVLLLETINQVYLSDISTLETIYRLGSLNAEDSFNPVSCVRLHNCGLINYLSEIRFKREGEGSPAVAIITYWGKIFCEAVLQIKNDEA